MELNEIELRALQYVINAGGMATIATFDDDHEPIGATLRAKLVPSYLVEHGGNLRLKDMGRDDGMVRDHPPRKLQDGWRYVEARERDRWIVGVDLGQSNDPTAICAMQHTVRIAPRWTCFSKSRIWKQNRVERFDVRHLERLPLGMPYPDQVRYVGGVLKREPLTSAKLVIDETGVGRAVGDIFNTQGMYPMRITITAGLEVTRAGGSSWHVPKSVLMSAMEARQHTGELRVAPGAKDAEALKDELKDFQRHVTAAGRATWGARTGAHDDLVLAVAIALFEATDRTGECSREELRI